MKGRSNKYSPLVATRRRFICRPCWAIERGQRFTITRQGRAIARLVPLDDDRRDDASRLVDKLRARSATAGPEGPPRRDAGRLRRAGPRHVLTVFDMSCKMSYMSKPESVSVRELQQNLKRVMARVEGGRTIEITRRRRPVARLEPLHPPAERPASPDLEERTTKVFAGRTIVPGGSATIIDGRGDR